MGIPSLLAEGDKSWWQFWKKPPPEPDAFTILGMDPLTAGVTFFLIAVLAYSIYTHPSWFFRGLSESMGWVVGFLAIGVAIGGAVAVYTWSLAVGLAAFVVYLVVVGIAIIGINGF